MVTKLTPVHPGAILREEFIEGLQLTPYKVAKAIHVAPRAGIEPATCRLGGDRSIHWATGAR